MLTDDCMNNKTESNMMFTGYYCLRYYNVYHRFSYDIHCFWLLPNFQLGYTASI